MNGVRIGGNCAKDVPLVQSNSITGNPRVVSRRIFHYFAQHEPIIRILLVERSVYT